MPSVRYVGPFGPLDLPSLGLSVMPGETVEVDDESFANLIEQTDFEAADPAYVAPVATQEPEAAPEVEPDLRPETAADADENGAPT